MDVCSSFTSNSLTESLSSGKNYMMCFNTSTPKMKPLMRVFIEKRNIIQRSSSYLTSPNGPPPSIPTTPKPQAAITRLEVEEIDTIAPQENLDSSSFFENTTGNGDPWFPRDPPIENDEMQIKRRYSDIPRQPFPLSPNWNNSLLDFTSVVNSKTSVRYTRFSSACSLRHTESQRLGFDRNSPIRIAKHRRLRKSVQMPSSRINDSATTNITSLRKYKDAKFLSSFKQNETPLRRVE